MRIFATSILFLSSFLLGACDRLGVPDPARDAAIKESDARATGSACRHAGRAIEDCYTLNPDAARSAVYAGWKEMNDYMRENKIEEVKPVVPHIEVSEASEGASASEQASEQASAHASASASASKNH